MAKPIIYQLLPRLFTNYCKSPVFNGSIMQNGSGKLNFITPKILKEIKALGATHVWYTGVIEHAHDADYTKYGIRRQNPHIVKGKAGSPYAICDYYDIDPDIAVDVPNRMAEFEALVDRTHKAGMEVIIDFVPNHVARQYYSDVKPAGIKDFGVDDNKEMFFSPSNNFFYITRQQFAPQDVFLGEGADQYIEFPAKASGNDCFTAFPTKNDWYETVKLNYGVDPWNGSKHFDPIPPTWMNMLHILRYWASKGVDGFRCDMAHMVPVEFWHWAIRNVKSTYPDVVFIAEIYDVSLYRPYIHFGGFDYLYDKVNLYDTLFGIERNGLSAANLTSCWQTVDNLSAHMLNFLENHDEVRYASRFYAGDPYKVTASLVISAMLSTGPMMIYAGQELGEDAAGATGFSGDDGRTSIFDYTIIPTLRQWLNDGKVNGILSADQCRLRDTYKRILNLCNSEKSISDGKFFDLMYVNYDNPDLNPHKQYAFIRYNDTDVLMIVVNFDTIKHDVKINVPDLAIKMMDIKSDKYKCTNLLTGETDEKFISDDARFETDVPAYGAVIWKFKGEKPDRSDSEDKPQDEASK